MDVTVLEKAREDRRGYIARVMAEMEAERAKRAAKADGLAPRVLEFLSRNKGSAFTEEEICAGVFQKRANGSDRQVLWDALSKLIGGGKVDRYEGRRRAAASWYYALCTHGRNGAREPASP